MKRAVHFIIGLALLPVCWAAGATLVRLVALAGQTATSPLPHEWVFMSGALLWFVLYTVLPPPVRVYVLAHELTHSLWALLLGRRVSNLYVGRDGGSVEISRHHFLITLAPYFFPFYAALLLMAFVGLSLMTDQAPYEAAWIAALGVAWGFHISFTISTLLLRQPDIRQEGLLFSYALIVAVNLLEMTAAAVLLSDVGWGDLARVLARELRTAFSLLLAAGGWIAEHGERALRRLRSFPPLRW